MNIKIKSLSGIVPKYAKEGDAGFDLAAYYPNDVLPYLKPGERMLIATGLFMELPLGTELQIRSRSGLALKQGIVVLNAPGTIDANYRGEIGVILINHGKEDFFIKNGDRIAQGVLNVIEEADFTLVDEVNETDRGVGGFGHTGV